ncbi:CRISPR-associated endonuclease Cas2 [Candidatus Poribacteria bacterium]|nr:CRISPR-associated endonuclease Cas2 [Candidatus Poribacteria bacterium]
MYIILVYDIEEQRVAKVCKYLRQHLTWVQNSVFEGELTRAQLAKVKRGVGIGRERQILVDPSATGKGQVRPAEHHP